MRKPLDPNANKARAAQLPIKRVGLANSLCTHSGLSFDSAVFDYTANHAENSHSRRGDSC